MAIIKNLDYQDAPKEAKKSSKTKELKVKVKKDLPVKKNKSSYGALIVVVIVILAIIGLVFAYTNGKLSDLKNNDQSQTLTDQVNALKQEIQNLNDKAKALEKDSAESKGVVIDLFDKSRTLPKTVETADWLVYNNEKLLFSVKFPAYWEVAKTVDTAPEQPAVETKDSVIKTTDKTKTAVPVQVLQTIYLQPKNEANFGLAMTIKNDYLDLSALTIDQKYDLFKSLRLIDKKDFAFGKMLYYIDLDKDNNEIPTILILTEKAIYRATFNVLDKSVENYIKYRIDFENIASTLEIIKPTPAAPAPVTETPVKP